MLQHATLQPFSRCQARGYPAIHLVKKKRAGNCLFFRDVAIQVSSAQTSLTSVFGMGTGGSSSLSAPAVLWGLCHWTTICWHRPHSRVQHLAYSRTHTHPPAPLAFCRLAWCLQSPHSLFSFVKVLCRFSFHALSGSYVPFLRTAALAAFCLAALVLRLSPSRTPPGWQYPQN